MLGTDLKQVRLDLGLSQAGLSELTNIPQARLSGFELGKLILNDFELIDLKNTLENTDLVKDRITRKKRYTKNRNIGNNPVAKKRRAYNKTTKNKEYLKSLDLLWSMHASPNKKQLALVFLLVVVGLV